MVQQLVIDEMGQRSIETRPTLNPSRPAFITLAQPSPWSHERVGVRVAAQNTRAVRGGAGGTH